MSYGPCQFPTLGFVVERFKQIREFKPEKFWYLSCSFEQDRDGKNERVGFQWARHRIFDKLVCLVIYERCLGTEASTQAKVTDVAMKQRIRYRPQPLNTIEM